MSFISPLWLIGIGSSAIPLVIHLIGRRREGKVDFSSLRLLREVERRRSVWVKVRRLLLLLIRMAICAGVFLLLARPVVNLRNATFTHAPTAACLVIDDSPSMERGSKAGITEAREEALMIVDRLTGRDEIYVLTTSGTDEFGPSSDPNRAAEYIKGLTCSDLAADMRLALERAQVLLESSRKINRVVYLISDFQATSFGRLDDLQVSNAILVDVGGEVPNLAIIDVASEELLSPGGTARLRIVVANYSDHAAGSPFSVWLDGVKTYVGSIEVAAQEEEVVEVDVAVGEAGFHSGRVELTADDGLSFDNTRFFTLQVPLEIRVLVVSGTSAEGLYLDKALRPAEDVFTPFRVDLVQPHRMLTRDILSYAVVALNDVKDLDFGELKMLEKYFEAGGRAFILLGEKADVDFYNRVILPEFQIHARPLVEISSPGFVTIGRVETSHPVLSVFRESRWGDFSTVKFFSYHPLEGLSSQGLAWFTNGQLALAEAPERGIVFAGSPGTSDITKRAVFVPLIHRLFHYLARREEVPTGISTGERFRMSTGKSLRTVKCVTPEGTQIRVVPKVVGGETVITLSDTKHRGIYEVEGDQKPLALFPANTDPEESLVAQVNSETLQSLFGAQSLAGTDVIDGQMGLGRYELTKLILWVLLGLVILEFLVIHRR